MMKIEKHFQLLQSILNVSGTLVEKAGEFDLDSVDRLLKEQQRLLDKALENRENVQLHAAGSADKSIASKKIGLLISGIDANMHKLVGILNEKKHERFVLIKQARKQSSISTYIRKES